MPIVFFNDENIKDIDIITKLFTCGLISKNEARLNLRKIIRLDVMKKFDESSECSNCPAFCVCGANHNDEMCRLFKKEMNSVYEKFVKIVNDAMFRRDKPCSLDL